MGSGSEVRKLNEFEEEKTRSKRTYIGLEEKKESEELKGKKNSGNTNYDENDDEPRFPIKKIGNIYKQCHHQITSSTQLTHDGQNYTESGSSSQSNVSSLYVLPEKHILESVLDVLQRNDPEEFFAKPVINPNGVEDYDRIAKTPLDFGTIRAKINKELYISVEDFKFDVYLLCFNALSVHHPYSRPYQVAEAIQNLAIRVFEDVSVAGLQRFNLESLATETPLSSPSRIPQVGQPKSIGHARFRHISPENSIESPTTNIIPNISQPWITPQAVVAPSLAEAATTLENEKSLMIGFKGSLPPDICYNVSGTQPNHQTLGSNLPRQENTIARVTSLSSYLHKRESNANGNIQNPNNLSETINTWKTPSRCNMVSSNANVSSESENRVVQLGGSVRQNNTCTMIPQFVDKHVASSSKDGVGASSSHMRVFSSQDENFATRANNPNISLYGLNSVSERTNSKSNVDGYFQGLVIPSTIFHFNQSNEQSLYQAKQNLSGFPINGYSDMAVKVGQVSPMGPFPMLQQFMSSSSGFASQVFPSSSSNNVMRGNMKGKEIDQDGDDEEELNLDLKL
uniref:Uncharacterized protein LOC101509794 n=1 Tax=Cicer arietinum TaxID=3827 RepID=A0A3Q7Y8L3_CICAR|nr:uncharacterized protein LOC101509794 [Cicer arietinum]